MIISCKLFRKGLHICIQIGYYRFGSLPTKMIYTLFFILWKMQLRRMMPRMKPLFIALFISFIVGYFITNYMFHVKIVTVNKRHKNQRDVTVSVKYRNQRRRAMTRLRDCSHLHYSRNLLPLTALASFPGSGNTWVRHLVQQATGIYTGSVYLDPDLKTRFPAEGIVNRSVILVKTHEWGARFRQAFQKAVLLVRDPYRALLAEFNRIYGGHIGYAPLDKFKSIVWTQFVEKQMLEWVHIILDWLQLEGPLHVILYENLRGDPKKELRKLFVFLGMRVPDSRLECVLSNSEGSFQRDKRTYRENPFNRSMRAVIDIFKTTALLAVENHNLREFNKCPRFDG